MENHLPREILDKKKVGLEMPYSRWLKTELADMVHDYLGADRLKRTDIFDPAAVRRLVDEHMAGRKDHGRALWGLLNFSIWHEMYIE
jgi:asparagine synthase (glutamine-hydrolysing)